MKAKQTTITIAGVMRCCLDSVAEEYVELDEDVEAGAKSQCKHCREPFTLTQDGIHFVWRPDWQIKLGEAKPND